MSEWQSFDDPPSEKVMVELFFGNLVLRDQRGEVTEMPPWRDCRRELGYWDGENFCDLNTGHEIPEYWRDDDPMHKPTHWRALPPGPQS
jgi:hypothetical protein